MEYKEITIYTTTQGIDIVSGFLTMQGIRGVVIEDSADFNSFLKNNHKYWDYVDESLLKRKTAETNVKFYLPKNMQSMEIFNHLTSGLEQLRIKNPAVDLGRLVIKTANVNEEDWSTAWKKYYHPTKVGKRLVVVPCWEEYTLNDKEVQVTLNPGMAFGTGTHETTRLCMRLLEDCVTPDKTMLDIGTGSGILAITSLLLGARSAVGIDIDELAVKTAMDNARLNNVQEKLTVCCGDLTEKVNGKFDLVCANIVADVIIRLCDNITQFMKKGSILLVSGIIEERCEEVKSALLNAGLSIEDMLTENGWAAIKTRL